MINTFDGLLCVYLVSLWLGVGKRGSVTWPFSCTSFAGQVGLHMNIVTTWITRPQIFANIWNTLSWSMDLFASLSADFFSKQNQGSHLMKLLSKNKFAKHYLLSHPPPRKAGHQSHNVLYMSFGQFTCL